jgi:23S rRNA (adenine2503-C2)-methyltransferase
MKESTPPLVYDFTLEGLEDHFRAMGEPAFRAKQVWVAIYQHFKQIPDEITTLPLALREKLSKSVDFQALTPVRSIQSADGLTEKTLFTLRDGNPIETVLMFYEDRRTVCISSQSGCALGCSFCATGQMGFHRNLSSGEIIAQVLYFNRILDETAEQVTNVVVMGMGEPFANYENVMDALNRMNHPDAMGLGARRFTISTVGLVPEIIAFADEETQYNLAVSLHTVDDALRSKLIPINRKYPVAELLQACRYYVNKTSRRITFEVALIAQINDSTRDAEALASKLTNLQCLVNLIPLNPSRGYGLDGAPLNSAEAYAAVLEAHNIPVTIRLRRGVNIQAGCGQLAANSPISTNS